MLSTIVYSVSTILTMLFFLFKNLATLSKRYGDDIVIFLINTLDLPKAIVVEDTKNYSKFFIGEIKKIVGQTKGVMIFDQKIFFLMSQGSRGN